MVKKIAVRAESTKYFSSQRAARDYAMKLLEAGLTFIQITEIEVDDY